MRRTVTLLSVLYLVLILAFIVTFRRTQTFEERYEQVLFHLADTQLALRQCEGGAVKLRERMNTCETWIEQCMSTAAMQGDYDGPYGLEDDEALVTISSTTPLSRSRASDR